jgi:hypothetical protein
MFIVPLLGGLEVEFQKVFRRGEQGYERGELIILCIDPLCEFRQQSDRN